MRVAVVCAVALCAGVTMGAAVPVTPEEAIRAAVLRRFGASAAVTVSDVVTSVAGGLNLVAEPEVTARLGRPARFVLSAGTTRRGVAVAVVQVTSAYPRASRRIARDEEIDSTAIDLNEGTLPSLPIRPLLGLNDLKGLRARRDIAAGEPLTAAVLRVAPVVKSGDHVDVTIRIGAVSVTGTGIASGSGQIGDVIRVMQPNSSRLLNARIVGAGAVEIVE